MASIDKDKQLEYNLAVLKRRDAAITEVLKMAGHVVLYQFNEDSQSWDLKKARTQPPARGRPRPHLRHRARRLSPLPHHPRRLHRRSICTAFTRGPTPPSRAPLPTR